MHTMTLARHTARLIACLAEAVEFAQTTSPGTGHNASMWHAAITEAQQALDAQAELSTLRGAEVRELRAEIAGLEADEAHAIDLLRRLLDLYDGQRLAPPETFVSYWGEVRALVADAPPATGEAITLLPRNATYLRMAGERYGPSDMTPAGLPAGELITTWAARFIAPLPAEVRELLLRGDYLTARRAARLGAIEPEATDA